VAWRRSWPACCSSWAISASSAAWWS
jgi:hypothetical protein